MAKFDPDDFNIDDALDNFKKLSKGGKKNKKGKKKDKDSRSSEEKLVDKALTESARQSKKKDERDTDNENMIIRYSK